MSPEDGRGDPPQEILDMLRRLHALIPPTDEEMNAMFEEADTLDCGFIMLDGKPGTLQVHPLVPRGTIMIIKIDIQEFP